MIFNYVFFWSALATAPTSAYAGAKEGSNSTDLIYFVSNHKTATATSRQPSKLLSTQLEEICMLKFGIQAYFNPTKGCPGKNVSRIFFVFAISQLLHYQNLKFLSLPHIIPGNSKHPPMLAGTL